VEGRDLVFAGVIRKNHDIVACALAGQKPIVACALNHFSSTMRFSIARASS